MDYKVITDETALLAERETWTDIFARITAVILANIAMKNEE